MRIDTGALKNLWRQAFGDPIDFIDGFFREGFSPDRCGCVYENGQLGAALYWFDCLWNGQRVAYIYAVATEEMLRGRGLCRQLMEETHSRLQAQGYAGAVLVPAEPGVAAMYEKFGYRYFCPMKKQRVLPAEKALDLQVINPEVYGQRRIHRLPQGGIRQDGNTLAFLGTYARFYTAGDALFCAAQEGATLYFQEFFGETALLPGIVAAFGAENGVVRIYGEGEPFAMYRSLTRDDALPSYFGIALD